MTFVELCAGAAAVTIRLLGGENASPPVSWMGGKRRHATAILHALGLRPGDGGGRLMLVDASSWGWVWPVLLDPVSGAHVAMRLRSWEGEDPSGLWRRLASIPLHDHPAEAAAQWLWLQARSASGAPVWWDSRWCQGSGGGRGPQPMGQRGGWRMGEETKKSKRGSKKMQQTGMKHLTGFMHPATLADRIEALPNAMRGVLVEHRDVRDVDPIEGALVYFDPPYEGRTGYESKLTRADVIEVAQRWSNAGSVVAVSEAEPLDIPGWHALDISWASRSGSKCEEWLTISAAPSALYQPPKEQLRLWGHDAL